MIESEKILEKKLVDGVKKLGGWSLKFPPVFAKGIPDRLCLFPGGLAIFVEMKTTGKKPTDLQLYMHSKLQVLGFRVEVIDSTEKINSFLCSIQASSTHIK